MKTDKASKMNVLQKIKSGEIIPHDEEHDFILLDLADDQMISVNSSSSIDLTYFGFKSLEEWDPFLQVSISNQLLEKPYGDA